VTWQVRAVARALGIPVILPTDRTLNEPIEPVSGRTLGTVGRSLIHRVFDGFFTSGWLGTQALLSLGVPGERIATGLYPIDAHAWRARAAALSSQTQAIREGLGGSAVVLAVTKLASREDPLCLLEGFAQCSDPSARLLLVGDGPLRGAVEARSVALGLQQRVRLTGYVPYPELPAYFAAADVFVHVPRREPWGISVSEAMALGVPVVAATSVGAAADLVIPHQTGRLVSPGDASALGSAITDLLRERSSAVRESVLRRVDRVDVEHASAELEGLVQRLGGPARWHPMATVVRQSVKNAWGTWAP
jgi:glycosyltransferase involved in cell wall biosynthesis